MRQTRCGLLLLMICLSPTLAIGQVFDEKFDHWPVDHRIRGQIIVAGKLSDPAQLQLTFRRLKFPALLMFDKGTSPDIIAAYRSALNLESAADEKKRAAQDAKQDKTKASETSDTDKARVVLLDQPADAVANIDAADQFVLWHSDTPLNSTTRKTLLAQRDAFAGIIDRGATLMVVGTPVELLARYSYENKETPRDEIAGMNLIPDTIVETHFTPTSAAESRLLSALAMQPRCVGIGLEDDTTLFLSGRLMGVTGTGNASFYLMANGREPVQTKTIGQRTSRRQSAANWLVDLTQWRRQAIDRTLPVFPPAEPPTPRVKNGTLVIVGGGGTPKGLMQQIVDLAGGPEKARMVYIPCSSEEAVSERQSTVRMWQRMGVQHATYLHTKDRNRANSDEEFLAPLKDATGLWFGGGRQWNFSDSYYGTKAHKLMKDVLRRGGVIGGSSAGASIQARYLARATPIENFDIMAPGYERGGLGFIGGVAIDQHFSQRRRQRDMTQLVNKYPQLLGIGIDEATAIIVKQSKASVVGRGRVHFYDRNLPVYPDRPDYIALPAGSAYDLAERKVLLDSSEESESEKPAAKAKKTEDKNVPAGASR